MRELFLNITLDDQGLVYRTRKKKSDIAEEHAKCLIFILCWRT